MYTYPIGLYFSLLYGVCIFSSSFYVSIPLLTCWSSLFLNLMSSRRPIRFHTMITLYSWPYSLWAGPATSCVLASGCVFISQTPTVVPHMFTVLYLPSEMFRFVDFLSLSLIIYLSVYLCWKLFIYIRTLWLQLYNSSLTAISLIPDCSFTVS